MLPANPHYIITHGLNLRPSAMIPLAERLGWPLDDCTFISLPGHREGESWQDVTAARWLDSFGEQYQAAAQTGSPIIYLGYSLGGLLMTYLLAEERIPAPNKQILLAPALAFKPWTQLPVYFPGQHFNQWLVPSFAPKQYKFNRGVTIGAYKAMFEISRRLERMDTTPYNIPTLVLCDQRDEMVSAPGLKAFVERKNLSQWQLRIFPSRRLERWGKKHMLVAREYQPDVYWQQIKDQVDAFLG